MLAVFRYQLRCSGKGVPVFRCGFSSLSIMLFGLLLLSPRTALAQDIDGKGLLAKYCSACHAISRSDASAMERAPPFRDIYRRFVEKDLETVIMQGAVSHYPRMPQIEFSRSEAAAIVAYLATLQ